MKDVVTGWVVLIDMGKDFAGKKTWLPNSHILISPVPVVYPTKAAAMKRKRLGERVVRATVTTEWED